MADLEAKHKSTNILTVTITDDNGERVTGATVKLTVKDSGGSAVTGLDDVTMVEDSSDLGHYEYTIAATHLATEDATYTAEVTATKDTNQRYAEKTILNKVA